MAEQIQEVALKLRMYRDEHQYPPFKKVITDGVYELDFKKLGYKDVPQVTSPYSGKGLPLLINEKGELFVDYRIDLYEALKKMKDNLKKVKISGVYYRRIPRLFLHILCRTQ